MNHVASDLKLSVIISSLLLIPFIALQIVNRRAFDEGFPFPLFVLMWLLSLVFFFTLTPIVQKFWRRQSIMHSPMGMLLRVALLIPIAWLFISLLIDQMPCFLGVPNCD